MSNSTTSIVSSAITSATSIASSAFKTATPAFGGNESFMDMISEKFLVIQEIYVDLFQEINFEDRALQISIFFVAFNPIFWNIVARLEYSTHFLTKLAGSAKRGCYLLAMTIFSLGLVRDYFFEQALHNQFSSPYLQNEYVKMVGVTLFGFGQLLVLTSMYQLGITGTYLGDYFGILMDERVTAFPFNVSNNPMYQGSTLSFLGTALIYGKSAGLLVAFMVQTMYNLALKLEEPFTAQIYAKRDEAKSKKSN
ncbi:hypothetical protein Kpol_1054p55 [Vanderwaltozyma polyspora DSM 70294]|uniref:Phosphatidyl-N-methylethanolamine N-methyltransferase n=1 Tax=Vanderwaltozyma polyspora (strain ATCC 22028 / DSM 70294 / BCRC 21397 / CBS 2163 / NBRC 10782 / NRRL Y-8283 / UCD 57-17) TaxID=436907 RepID=A7TIE1_VANPO|nr:uncharacterized protein Kpol_1054p55 [Vanderwaltozyma polyspora DSM 70294]EDO18007.1 hypothetical protein Kpol_1054p55 [Vanderwaltozyma polyspora DSM 70294]